MTASYKVDFVESDQHHKGSSKVYAVFFLFSLSKDTNFSCYDSISASSDAPA